MIGVVDLLGILIGAAIGAAVGWVLVRRRERLRHKRVLNRLYGAYGTERRGYMGGRVDIRPMSSEGEVVYFDYDSIIYRVADPVAEVAKAKRCPAVVTDHPSKVAVTEPRGWTRPFLLVAQWLRS